MAVVSVLLVVSNFSSSMRDVGYGSEGQAICDIADNSIEATTAVHVLDKSGSRGAINPIVIADSRSWIMDPEWLEASIGFVQPVAEPVAKDWADLAWA